jgi:hypothetical protein
MYAPVQPCLDVVRMDSKKTRETVCASQVFDAETLCWNRSCRNFPKWCLMRSRPWLVLRGWVKMVPGHLRSRPFGRNHVSCFGRAHEIVGLQGHRFSAIELSAGNNIGSDLATAVASCVTLTWCDIKPLSIK